MTVAAILPVRSRASPDAVARLMQEEERAGFRGAVSIDRAGEPLEWASAGMSPTTTRFWIASISKAITATAAVKLAEQGALDLDLSVAKAFSFVSGELGERTLKQLLAHRAGLGMHYAADGISSREEAVRAIAKYGIEKTGFFYSNDGYSLAAALMEEATGKDFESLVRAEVFSPAGMASAAVWGEPVSEVAPTPPLSGKMVRDGMPTRNYGQLGASGICATASDMMRLLRALQAPDFAPEHVRELLWTPGWTTAPGAAPRSGTSYGLGWALDVEHGIVQAAYHGGNEDWLRHNGQTKIWLDRPARIVILSNSGDAGRDSWSQRILSKLEKALSLE